MLDRILARVGTVRPGRMLATAAVYPFYLLGVIAGGVVFVALIVGAAVAAGFKDGRRR